jgi:hypothetical protein
MSQSLLKPHLLTFISWTHVRSILLRAACPPCDELAASSIVGCGSTCGHALPLLPCSHCWQCLRGESRPHALRATLLAPQQCATAVAAVSAAGAAAATICVKALLELAGTMGEKGDCSMRNIRSCDLMIAASQAVIGHLLTCTCMHACAFKDALLIM